MAMKPTAAKSAQLQALLRQGFEALSRGQVQQAGDLCRQVLGMQPDLVEGHFLVGLVALEMRDRRTAFSAFGSVTRLQPDHAAAWAQLAKLFIGDGQLNRADAALDEVARAQTSDPMIPAWVLAAGDWQDLVLGANISSPADPVTIEGRFERDDGSSVPVRVEFQETLQLRLDREGLTRLDEDLNFTLVDRLRPKRWFPTVNLTNLKTAGDGTVVISPTSNIAVYGQISTALDQSARDWLDP